MSSLAERLSRLRQSGAFAPSRSEAGVQQPENLNRSRRAAAATPNIRRPVAHMSERRSISGRSPGENWYELAPYLWEKVSDGPALLPQGFSDSLLIPKGLNFDNEVENLLFYDLETTGLSGGAGTVAFLAGLGRQIGDVFRVTQLFLADYPGEDALLTRLEELYSENEPQVSFNGLSFDSQVLKTRFLLNRRLPPVHPQIDLLYPARRLWRPLLPNVSLGTLESELLGVVRLDDLPGREAPDAWFDWLDGDTTGRIEGVFRHNEEDIRSLARLFTLIEKWAAWVPGTDVGMPVGLAPSAFGMARQCAIRAPEKERLWLNYGWHLGNHRCGRELGLRFRRAGEFTEARKVWERLGQDGLDFYSAVELSKYWEHHCKNPEEALRSIEGLERLQLGDRRRSELDYRRARLERKIHSRKA